jgi:hypothetical protein
MRWILLCIQCLREGGARRAGTDGEYYARETPRIEVEVEAGHPSRFGPGENSNVT